MKREIEKDLLKWKNSQTHKPLLVRGARQVGKTFSVRELGKSFNDFFEVNFELYEDVIKIFQNDLEPKRIIRDISLFFKKKIIPDETLLFFDEIQECPNALKSLRYFYEKMPELHIIAAGSLLEFELERTGIPVGRISMLYMYPFSFAEFLTACGYEEYLDIILKSFNNFEISEVHHNKLLKLLGEYLAIGGMPESVNSWVNTHDLTESYSILRGLSETFKKDFLKYSKKAQIKYVEKIFNEVPLQIGNKFKFSSLSGEYRKRELQPALNLLVKANIVHPVYHTSAQGIPIGAGSNFNRFKLIFIDIALMQVILGLDPASWILDPLKQMINKGKMVEAFLGQEILAYSPNDMKAQLYYWHREAKSSNAEVDYILSYKNQIIPIEVKSGKRGPMKSMKRFLIEHKGTEYGIRFYTGLPNKEKDIYSFPLYSCFAIYK